MKKGRHRRFEEARALKRDTGANGEEDFSYLLNDEDNVARPVADDDSEDDPYAKYVDSYEDDDSEETKK